MIVIGYGSTAEEPRFPLVPDWVVVTDGNAQDDYILSKDGLFEGPVGNTPFKPISVEVPDRKWFGILENGSIEIFDMPDEFKWRTQQAAVYVEEANRTKKDNPIRSVECLQSAASLLNIGLGNLIRDLSTMKKDPSESLADAFLRLKTTNK